MAESKRRWGRIGKTQQGSEDAVSAEVAKTDHSSASQAEVIKASTTEASTSSTASTEHGSLEHLLGSAPEQCSHRQSVQSGRLLEPGMAYFPVMSPEEVASISVSASAPPENMKAVLERHGVCLVTGILTAQECQSFENLWQADLCNVIDFKATPASEQAILKRMRKDGLAHWPHDWSDSIGKKDKGSSSQRGMPHGSFAWNARLHQGVRTAFANIFNVAPAELAVGLDCTFWSAADSPTAEFNSEWLHCDQNHRTGLTWPCFQGVLYVWPSEGEGASTTALWPGSHREVYQRLMDDNLAKRLGRHRGGQSIRLCNLADASIREELTHAAVAGSRRVPCPAGSLLLWDSRLIHQGWAGGPRLAQPVCWEPRIRREQDYGALQRKIFMCAAGVPSSHSSCEARVHGMAPRQPPRGRWPRGTGPVLKPQLMPWCIEGRKAKGWESAQDMLWGGTGDPRNNADLVDVKGLMPLLKPEVLEAL